MNFTIITATYNSYPAIKDCIGSIAQQSVKPEHIIIDGQSEDKTLTTIKNSPSVSQYISEPDKGIYDALNKGIQRAKGDVIGFLHSDDVLADDEVISDISKIFDENNAIDGVYGDLVFVKANDTNKITRYWKSTPFKHNNVKYAWMPPHPTLFLRREVYEKHGLFDTSFKCAGDYDFMLRIMQDKDIELAYLPKVITRMRIGGASTGSIKGILIKSKEDIRALRNRGFKFPYLIVLNKNLRKLPQLLKRPPSTPQCYI